MFFSPQFGILIGNNFKDSTHLEEGGRDHCTKYTNKSYAYLDNEPLNVPEQIMVESSI